MFVLNSVDLISNVGVTDMFVLNSVDFIRQGRLNSFYNTVKFSP